MPRYQIIEGAEQNTALVTTTERFTIPQMEQILEQARLSGIINQRDVKQYKVDEYMRLMQDGKWNQGLTPIYFLYNGDLIDGQHRFLAAIAAKLMLTWMVVRGCTKNMFAALGGGLPRSIGDMLRISGKYITADDNATYAATILSGLYNHDELLVHNYAWEHSRQPYQYLEPIARRYEDVLQTAIEMYGKIAKRFALSPQVACTAYCVCALKDKDAADEFFTKLLTGEELKLTDPIYLLRTKYMSKKKALGGGLLKKVQLAIVLKAWDAWYNETPITARQLTWNTGNAFPNILEIEAV